MNGIWYSLVFARGDVTLEELEMFKQVVKEHEGVEVQEWGRFTGSSARRPKLLDDRFIFTGTASGFIEPAQGYGTISSIIGGKIAAIAVRDREKAQAEYDRFINPIKGHIKLKKTQPDYRPSVHFRMGQLWFDIPTLKAGVPDHEVENG